MNDAFDEIVESMDYPMAIVTVAHEGHRSGCLVGFHTQCSIEPRRWIVCISKANHTYRVARDAQRLAVHPLRDDQRDLAKLFGEATGDETDKFARCRWHGGPHGTPILDGCNWLAGRIVERVDLGDHVGHIVEVTDAGAADPSPPQLGFQQVRDMEPGHPA